MHNTPLIQQQHARAMRHHFTDAERWLWQRLRARQLLGWKFRRQHPLGGFYKEAGFFHKLVSPATCPGMV
ncbi:MAG: DUF559 domain-containing protein [Chromatiaceae bacterium]|nr:DUF559 domain-containing protein [Chromatiaceae bacterium]